jgi:CRISPR-associated protein Csm1
MSCGLKKERLTISRLFTLSRQLNYYFSLYLPHLFMTDDRFRNIYTVFAGGDDLFLIGPWNRTYELSLVINRRFSDYVCSNPAVHISSGLALQKAHTPLPLLAESAEEALEKSKSGQKNSLTMFYQTASWGDMEELEKIRKKFDELLRDEMFAKSMLYRLNGFIDMAQSAEKALSKREVSKEEMQFLKWRPLFYYSGVRNFGKKITDKQKRKAIVNELIVVMEQWVEKYSGGLKIPLWNVLYNNR